MLALTEPSCGQFRVALSSSDISYLLSLVTSSTRISELLVIPAARIRLGGKSWKPEPKHRPSLRPLLHLHPPSLPIDNLQRPQLDILDGPLIWLDWRCAWAPTCPHPISVLRRRLDAPSAMAAASAACPPTTATEGGGAHRRIDAGNKRACGRGRGAAFPSHRRLSSNAAVPEKRMTAPPFLFPCLLTCLLGRWQRTAHVPQPQRSGPSGQLQH
ncbi:hypothetical protein B0I37DRAFT_7564 [Chaetomium sp. MPI-CAGE-AT-0009]|nr:hypothetical protein B0I37DRAFT_7564 [Chaetomium sp. MPI-CAGE-AT-0009]